MSLLPKSVTTAVKEGDRAVVDAWIQANDDVDASDAAGWTLLHHCTSGNRYGALSDAHLTLAERLLARGAAVDAKTALGLTPLRLASMRRINDTASKLVAVLVARGAAAADILTETHSPTIAAAMLRAGADPDALARCLEKTEHRHFLATRASFKECRALVDGVIKAGSWAKFMRRDHIDLMAWRALAQRGRAATGLAALPYGVAWDVLSYWRPVR